MKRVVMSSIIQEQLCAYKKASRTQKSVIISAVVMATGMHRKAVIRAFAREMRLREPQPAALSAGASVATACQPPAPAQLGRPRLYTAETEAALAFVWEQYEYPSAERLHGEIPRAVRIFRRDRMWHYGATATKQLLSMSLGAMKQRTVAMAKSRGLLRGISTTRSSELLRSVPIFYGSWKHKGAGFGQIDTVVHSGEKLMGEMVYTVNYVDVAAYWQEPVAQLGKSKEATIASMQEIGRRLPWQLRGIHPDSGSEFINELGLAWYASRGIEITRSRPSKKNDNCFIEQRNLVVVRKYVGYERYDCVEAVAMMNELYAVLRLYINFFQPTFKIQRKERQPSGRYRRSYDTPKTPYQRVLGRDDVPQSVKTVLTTQYETLNPKVLRDTIQTLTTNLERIQRAKGYHF